MRGQLDEERIFHTGRKIESDEARDEYLEQICGDDQSLRERVESLLEVAEREKSFLASRSDLEPTIDQATASEGPGRTIGRYKLMEQIGEGGMGTVFVAQQERPIRRKVALKLIKPGMDTKAVVARFEAERQALAMMDHPNIAKVLDAGTTESGRPYFAMELVKGVPITDYCDRNRLTIRERLQLFNQVCHAIQHAHQKGIIHRDIKPSNVLVTLHDGKPVPKVIDFGVAKALNARLTDRTIYTEHLQVVGTMLYMSPEQAEFSGLDIDTRSDIYSLGVLLYELLTGTTPFGKEELNKAGFDEQRRMIREREPQRASVRISSLGETATAVAEHRKTDPKKLNQLLRGDLDWIVVKALEKDRTRRFDTAVGLAADVENYLNDDVITARPPSMLYRTKKFVRRNSLATATVVLVSASLLLGVVGVVMKGREARVQAIRADEQADRAKEEAERANTALRDVSDLAYRLAFTSALTGNVKLTEEAIGIALRSDAPANNLRMLRGLVAYANGEYNEAYEICETVLVADPNQFLAQAILTKTSIHAGFDDAYPKELNLLYRLAESKDLSDEEFLALAFAEGIDRPEKAMQTLEKVSANNHSPLKLSVKSEAMLSLALKNGDRAMCQASIDGYRHLEMITGKSLYTQLFQLNGVSYAIELAGHVGDLKRREELIQEGNAIENWLSLDKHGTESTIVRYWYQISKGNREQAWAALKEMDPIVGTYALFIALELMASDQPIEDATRQFDKLLDFPRNDDPNVSLARAYLVSCNLKERQFVEETTLRLATDGSSWQRRMAIYLHCILGNRKQAIANAQHWLNSTPEAETHQAWLERPCVEIVAKSSIDEDGVVGEFEPGSLPECVTWFAVAMKRMSQGQDPTTALRSCVDGRCLYIFEWSMANGLLKRLNEE